MSEFVVYTVPGSPYARAVLATLVENKLRPLATSGRKRTATTLPAAPLPMPRDMAEMRSLAFNLRVVESPMSPS